MRNIFFFLLCFIFQLNLTGQSSTDFSEKESTLIQLSNQFLKDSIQENRLKATKGFETTLEETLAKENSFTYPFEGLETVSILYPSDSTFRIFTWQVYVDKNDYRYGGIIQMNNDNNQQFKLVDQSAEIESYDLEYDVLGAGDWYGAIYFNMHDYDTPNGKQYLLFGFDGFEFFNKRKIVEALYFNKEGQPTFGAPAFAKVTEGYEANTQNRLYLEYSAEVAAKLNYDPNIDMIIMDNLVSMRSPYRGVGNVNIPDGSYVGYQLQNGVWKYIEKVFHTVSEKPPAPRKILDDASQKDIFGKKARGKKRDKNLPFKNK